MPKIAAVSAFLVLAGAIIAAGGDDPSCPMHSQHTASADGSAAHGAAVDQRHDTLGMSHQATHHSFRLFTDGGAIELRANSPDDAAAIDAIRAHLRRIADQFAAGDFSMPMFVHDKTPDGVDALRRFHDRVAYSYEPLPAGARVRIRTADAEALNAVHAFLRFQVVEHRTGNSAAIERDTP